MARNVATPRFLSTVDVPPPPTSNHLHEKAPNTTDSIIYTETDEAPALATYSLLPVIAKVKDHQCQCPTTLFDSHSLGNPFFLVAPCLVWRFGRD